MRIPLAIAVAAAIAAHAALATAAEDDTAVLRRQTQELLDAVSAGDASVWERYLDPGMIYITEANEFETKATLVPQITPLPAGIAGQIRISRFEVRFHGDVAVTFHVDEETGTYFGQPLKAQYWTTNTWHRTPAGWRLLEAHVKATLFEPPSITLPAAKLDEYVGTYRLTPEITYEIRREGAALVGQRKGRDPEKILVEATDVMFTPGQLRTRRVFQRDAQGRITGFASRREGTDIVWTRVR